MRMLANVQQKTIRPIMEATIAPGTTVFLVSDTASTTSTFGFLNGVMNIGLFAIVKVSTHGMTTETVSTKCMSIRWKASGHCCEVGCVLTEAFPRRACRCIWPFSS